MAKKQRELSPFEIKLNNLVDKYISRISFVDRMLFIHHLEIMIKAGLSIIAGLEILSKQTENKKLKIIIGEIKVDLEKGNQLSEALQKYPKLFPDVYVSMIGAGETSGKLKEALGQVSNQMKKSHELTSKIRGALIYPAVITVAMFGVAIEVVFFVLPKLMIMFKEFDADLPLATKILMGVVNFGQNYGLFLLVGIVLFIILLFWLLKQPNVKRVVHKINLKIPIFGKVIKKINLARFSLTLSSLLNSSIPIIDAVNITSKVVSNITYREILASSTNGLRKGSKLSEILSENSNVFPPLTTEMILVGEQTGQIEEMLAELAVYYGDEVDETMKNFSTIIEPVIILALGLAVGGIAVAVIQPMYTLAQSF